MLIQSIGTHDSIKEGLNYLWLMEAQLLVKSNNLMLYLGFFSSRMYTFFYEKHCKNKWNSCFTTDAINFDHSKAA